MQEAKAEGAIASLAQAVTTETTVLRGGQMLRVQSQDLVPGDIVLLSSGDKVPADLRLVKSRNLQVDESALTGESVPVEKSIEPLPAETPLAERTNMAYAGSFVTFGQGTGLVIATAGATEVGQISQSMEQRVNLTTPLTRKFAAFSRTLLYAILTLATLTFAIGLGQGESWEYMFEAAVAPGGECHPRRLARRSHHYPGHRRQPHGPSQRHHPQAACRGSPGQRHRDLFRQNRHPHRKPDDGAGHLCRRTDLSGQRQRLQPQRRHRPRVY